MSVNCPHCGNHAELVTGAVLYPHRADLAHLKFWRCAPCNAYVGCHRKGAVSDGVRSDGTLPLGKLANPQERTWRSRAHAAFDPLWKSARISRSDAYELLATGMGLDKKDCHIGSFTVEQCMKVIRCVHAINQLLEEQA
jgi:hypothetical protein